MKNIKKFLFNGSSASVLIPKNFIALLKADPEESTFYIILDNKNRNILLRHKNFSDKEYPLQRKLFTSGNSCLVAIPPDVIKVLGFEPKSAKFKILLDKRDIIIEFVNE